MFIKDYFEELGFTKDILKIDDTHLYLKTSYGDFYKFFKVYRSVRSLVASEDSGNLILRIQDSKTKKSYGCYAFPVIGNDGSPVGTAIEYMEIK